MLRQKAVAFCPTIYHESFQNRPAYKSEMAGPGITEHKFQISKDSLDTELTLTVVNSQSTSSDWSDDEKPKDPPQSSNTNAKNPSTGSAVSSSRTIAKPMLLISSALFVLVAGRKKKEENLTSDN